MDITIHHALLDKTLSPVHLGIKDGKIAVVSASENSSRQAGYRGRRGDGFTSLHQLPLSFRKCLFI